MNEFQIRTNFYSKLYTLFAFISKPEGYSDYACIRRSTAPDGTAVEKDRQTIPSLRSDPVPGLRRLRLVAVLKQGTGSVRNASM